MSDELLAEHAFRMLTHLVGAARELDAARLAAATGVHLGLYDPKFATELFRRGDRRFRGLGRNAPWHGDAVVGKQTF